MKLQSNNLLEKLSTGELKILTAEVKETVAKNPKKKEFLALQNFGISNAAEEIFSQKDLPFRK